MATETAVPMDDKELFAAATAPDPVEETPSNETVTLEQPRDEQGRFAPKEAPTTDAAPTQQPPTEPTPEQPKEDQTGQIPSWRLREESEARRAAEQRAEEVNRQLWQVQQRLDQLTKAQAPKQEPVDFFTNPDEAIQQRIAPIQDQYSKSESDNALKLSRLEAIIEFGKPAVAEMELAVKEGMERGDLTMHALAAQMRASQSPALVAMQWHQREKLVKETGGDITSYKARLADELMKDPAFQAKVLEAARGQAGVTTNPKIALPPSLTRTNGAGISNADLSEQDMSERALFSHATAGMRR